MQELRCTLVSVVSFALSIYVVVELVKLASWLGQFLWP